MKVLDPEAKTVSQELMFAVATMMEMIVGATTMAYKIERRMALEGASLNLYHQHKKDFNDARAYVLRVAKLLNNAFENELAGCVGYGTDAAARSEAIEEQSMDLVALLLIYQSKVCQNDKNRERIKRAVMKGYKGLPEYPIYDLLAMFIKQK